MRWLVLLTLALSFILPFPALAHVLVTDGSIGAVIHIDPDDDPIVGQQSSFFFELKDRTNKFDPAQCDCQVEIQEHGKVLTSQPLFRSSQPSLSDASFVYTFPKKDIYTLKVTGKPITPGEFQAFTLTYDLRVSRTSPTTSSPSNWLSGHIIHVIGAGGLALVVLVALIKQVYSKKVSKTNKKGGEIEE